MIYNMKLLDSGVAELDVATDPHDILLSIVDGENIEDRSVVRCGRVWCGVVWCGVVWCGVVWCGVVWRGVAGCGVVWCSVVGGVWRGVAWCGVVWLDGVGCGVVWFSGVGCGVVYLFFWFSYLLFTSPTLTFNKNTKFSTTTTTPKKF